MSSGLKNPYGLRDGVVVTPDLAVRGLASGCVCPGCGDRLIANHGTGIKQPYFSHESGHECETAYQTALHYLAKEVLATEKRVLLPPLEVTVDRNLVGETNRKLKLLQSRFVKIAPELCKPTLANKSIVRAGHYQKFEQVEIEVFMGEIIPDVVMHVRGRKLLVEILVTHPVTEMKRRWLEQNSLPLIEFDFRAADRTVTYNDLKKAFLQPDRDPGNGRSCWIHHPKAGPEQQQIDRIYRATYLNRIDELLNGSDPEAQAACNHRPEVVVGEDGVRRSICGICSKFIGRIP